MRRLQLGIWLSALWPVAAGAQTVASEFPPPLALVDAVGYALAQSDRVLEARTAMRVAGLTEELAQSSFGPKVVPNVRGSLGQADISGQTYGVGFTQLLPTGTRLAGNLAATTNQNQLGNFTSSDITVQVSQSVLRRFGQDLARRGLDSARGRVFQASGAMRLAEQEVAIDVAAAYYGIAVSETLVRSAQQARQRSEALLQASRGRLLAGRASRLDLLRAEQLVAEADLRRLGASTSFEDAKDQLRGLLNWPPDREFQVVTRIPLPDDLSLLKEAQGLAVQQRPEIAIARADLEEAEESARFAKGSLLPELNVGLTATRRETADSLGNAFGFDRFRLATFFELATSLDRTPQRVAHQNALVEVARRRRALETLEHQTLLEVRRSARQVATLRDALRLSELRVSLARQELEAATFRYRAGLAGTLDMVSAETNLLTAESGEVSLRADLAVADLRLRATAGVLDPRRDVH